MSWQVFIGRSNDLSRIAEVTYECSNKQLELSLNRGGSFSFTLPLTTKWKHILTPVKNCVILQRDKEVVWTGFLMPKEESFHEQRITLGAVGWQEILHHRFHTKKQVIYTETNAGEIIFKLLKLANDRRDTWISRGVNTDTQKRTITLEFLENLGDKIISLTEIENGCDIRVDPITRELNIYSPRDFEVRDVTFGYNWGPNNTSTFNKQTDAENMAQEFFIQGQFATAEARDEDAISEVTQLFQQVISLTEVADNDLLGAIANAEVAVNARPRELFSFTPIPLVEQGARLFKDYDIGDEVTVTAEKNGAKVEGLRVRIFGVSVSIDELGNERISNIQTTYQSS